MKRIAVFASGYGSNLQALIDYQEKNKNHGKIVLVFSNNIEAYAIKRAKKHKIKTAILRPEDFSDRKTYDNEVLKILDNESIDLVVLAGYMLLVGEGIIKKYANRIINIHPALLPSFKGTNGIKDAYDYGVKITGVTVHFVDEGLDTGPIILQEIVKIEQSDTLSMLEEKIHAVEHAIYPLAVKYYCQEKLRICGRKVIIEN